MRSEAKSAKSAGATEPKRSEGMFGAGSGGTLFLLLLLACGGGGSADNPNEGEAEAESEAESEGEDGNEAESEGDNPGEGEAEAEAESEGESVGDCNMYSFTGTWQGALAQGDCFSETLPECCLCCRDEDNCCTAPWEIGVTATLDHGSLAWYEDEGGWSEIRASANLELSIGGQIMSCSGIFSCAGGFQYPDVFCTEDRATCLTDGPMQDPPILPETCEDTYAQCMEQLPSQIGFRFENCQSPKSDPFVGDLWHISLNVSDISALHGGVARLICEGNPNFELTLNRDP